MRLLRTLAVPLGVLCTWTAAAPAHGQSSPPYLRTVTTAPYSAVTGGTPVPFPSRDDDEALVPIGFAFTYYGQTYDHVSIGTNGLVAMSDMCTTDAQCIGGSCDTTAGRCLTTLPRQTPNPSFPNSDTPQSVIGVIWDDLNLGARGDVTTQVVGTAPNRVFVVQYESVPHWDLFGPGTSSNSNANAQLRLSEADGSIRLHYGTFTAVASENTVWTWANGVENETGTQGQVGVACATTVSCDGTDLTAAQNTLITYAPPAGAELVVEGPRVTGGQPGDNIPVEVTLRNVGTATAVGTFFVDLHISAGATVTSTDTRLDRLTFTDVAGSAAITRTTTVQIPAVLSPGRYRIGAIADPTNVVTEVLEDNNVAILNDQFLVGAELGVEVDLPADTGPGETVDITYRVLNSGAAIPGVNTQIFLSQDQTLDPNDALVLSSTISVPALPVTAQTITATIPNIQPGDYWVIAIVDPANDVAEVDETNNIFVTSDRMFLDGPDLIADEVNTNVAFAFRGQAIDVTGAIDNDGGATARDFVYGLYLSTNALCSAASDPLLGEFGPVTIEPSGRLEIRHTVDVPPAFPVGDGFLCLIVNANGQVLEQSQNNNVVRLTFPLVVRDPGADFSIPEVTAPRVGAIGDRLTVARRLLNGGNATERLTYRVFLSRDDALDPAQDVLLGSNQLDLAPEEQSIGADAFVVPAATAPGGYRVIYLLDPDDDVDELSEANNLGVSTSSVTIAPAAIAIATTALPSGVVGVSYDVTVTATGGVGAYTWSVSQGSLPTGLELDAATGRITGTPEVTGTTELTLTVQAGAIAASRDFTLLVSDPSTPLEVLTRALPAGFVDRDYLATLVGFGGLPPYVWDLEDPDALPEGFTLDPDGTLTGRPSATTVAMITARVTDAFGDTATRPLVLRIVEARRALRLSDAALPDGRLGEAYEETIEVEPNTGEGPFVFEVVDGAPPPGLTLDAEGTMSGTPSEVGQFAFSVRVRDAQDDFDLNRFVVEIVEDSGVTFLTTSLPRGLLDAPYVDEDGAEVRISARSDTGTVSLDLVQGELPPGLAFDEGLVSGTPTARGSYAFVVLARDGAGQQDVRAYGIVIDEPVIVPEPQEPDGGCRCVAPAEGGGLGAFAGLGLLFGGLAMLRRRRRGAAALLALGVALPATATAQTVDYGPYQVETRTEPYVARTGGNTPNFSSTDDGDAEVALPFAFRYFEADYSSVFIGTNCLVRFGDRATSRFNTVMPSTDEIENLIGPFWDDCINPSVTTYVEGTAPNRVFIIQYAATENFGDAVGGQLAFQVWLYEGAAARFEVRYGPVTGMTDPSVWSASSGFEDLTGNRGGPLLPCNGTCDGTDFANAANMVVRAQQDRGVDLAAAGVSGLPVLAYAGVPFEVDVSLASIHSNPIGPFTFEVHALAEGETVPDRVVYTSTAVTLQGFEERTVPAYPRLPSDLSDGRYRLALVIDGPDAIAEINEDNNVAISAESVGLGRPRPNFVARPLTLGAAVAAPGDTVSADFHVDNRGNLAGMAEWRLVLSPNAIISVEDVELDRGTVNLDPSRTATVSRQVALPGQVASGDYVVGLIVDAGDAVAEIDELDNTSQANLRITDAQLAVSTSALPGAYVGLAYTHFLRAAGGDGRYAWSISAGALPAGLELVGRTGEIRGTPTTEETATFTVAVDSDGGQATADLELSVTPADGVLTILTRTLLPGRVGAAYPPVDPDAPDDLVGRLQVAGAQGEVTFTLENTPPPGLTLEADGRLVGTPQQAGRFALEVLAEDEANEARRTVALDVAEPGRLLLVSEALPEATLGRDYVYDFRVLGQSRTATATFDASSGLPPGLVVSTAGTLLGTPEQVGTFRFVVTVTEGTGSAAPRDTAPFVLEVQGSGDFSIGPATLPTAIVGEMYEEQMTADNGEAPLSWRVVGPALPDGLEFEVVDGPSGQSLRFRGTATAPGTAAVLVRCSDAAGRTAQQALVIEAREPEAEPPPMITPEEGCVAGGGASLAPLALLGACLALARRRKRR